MPRDNKQPPITGPLPNPGNRAPFEAILFDLGNTLIYFDGKFPEVFEQGDAEMLRQLRSAGFDPGGDAFLREFRSRVESYQAECDDEFIEFTTHYILRTLLDEWGYSYIPNAVLRAALDARYSVSRAYWQPEPDTAHTLEWLREQGYRLGLISNAGDDADVQALVDKAGIRHYFRVIATSAALEIRKPNPRIFHWVLQRLGTRPDQAAMVGDTLGADILGAQNAGLYSIWITRRADNAANRAHQDTIHPDAKIEALSELPALLHQLSVKAKG